MKARPYLWLLLLVGVGLAVGFYSWSTPRFDAPGGARVLCFALIGLLCPLVMLFQPEVRGRRSCWWLIWLPALFVRILLLPTAPSDDVNRYLWEGKLVAQGMSPYEATADAESWIPQRDRYWEAMNHRDKPTAYPPVVLWLFAAVGSLAYHPLAYKLAFVLADLFCLGLLLSLLRGRGLSPGYATFYSLNPLILLAYAGEAHFDVWMIAALLGGLWLAERGWRGLALVPVALAASIKWIALPLLPFFIFGWRGPKGLPARGPGLMAGTLLAAAVLIVPVLAFAGSNPFGLLHALFEFGTTRSFNGPVHSTLWLGLELSRELSNLIVALAFAAVLSWRWHLRARVALDTQIRWILGALIVFSPTVHFWYLAWLIPFVALRPSLPWLMLSVSAGAYFWVWTNAANGYWELQTWQMRVFWLPFFIGLLYELWSTRGSVLRVPRSPPTGARVAVVVPTLNAAEGLPRALASLRAQTSPVDAVIAVDGGSTDTTKDIVAACADLSLRMVQSEPGRGQQIAAGIEAASEADWVLVLHADAELRPDAVALLRRAVQAHPQAIGGAFGQRFSSPLPELVLIEALNDFRAGFTRTAFGDQAQFFRRDVCLRQSLFPAQPLMEDVESSWRVRESGEFLFLGQPCRAGHGKWTRRGWCARVRLVMSLLGRYRMARLRGRAAAEQLSRSLYAEYYAKDPVVEVASDDVSGHEVQSERKGHD